MKQRRKKMLNIFLCLVVGLAIGVIFGLFRLPLPVPHGWGGISGLIGMFIGGHIIELIINRV